MKRLIVFIIVICLIFSACNQQMIEQNEETTENQIIYEVGEDQAEEKYDIEAVNQTLNDWMLGTDYGIESVEYTGASKNVLITISDENYEKLENYDFDDR